MADELETLDRAEINRRLAEIGERLKPLEREEVLLRVRNLLHTRRLYTELASAKEALERHEGKPGKVP